MGRLAGKVAVVTGAAMGQGAAISRAFVAEGASVVLADIAKDAGQELADGLAASSGGRAHFVAHDVSDAASWASLVEDTEQRFDASGSVWDLEDLAKQVGGYFEGRDPAVGFAADSIMQLTV